MPTADVWHMYAICAIYAGMGALFAFLVVGDLKKPFGTPARFFAPEIWVPLLFAAMLFADTAIPIYAYPERSFHIIALMLLSINLVFGAVISKLYDKL